MPSYNVNITSYDTFRADVLAQAAKGLGFDLDGYYGYQCWDLGQLLYSQLGRFFYTESSLTGGTGSSAVATTWTYAPAKSLNSELPFTAVPVDQIKRGDMIIWAIGGSMGAFGHNGYADQDYTPGMSSINTLGQNQVDPSETQGHIPTINALGTNGILGAFRYTPWQDVEPSPTGNIIHKFPWVLYAQRLRARK